MSSDKSLQHTYEISEMSYIFLDKTLVPYCKIVSQFLQKENFEFLQL